MVVAAIASHLGLQKVNILLTAYRAKLVWMFDILIHVSEIVAGAAINNNTPGRVHLMVCHLFPSKPYHEPILSQFSDAYMFHQTWINFNLYF